MDGEEEISRGVYNQIIQEALSVFDPDKTGEISRQ
jgi:hypothetical protein